MTLYQYRPLETSSGHIRILVLAPAKQFESELECSLIAVDLSWRPKYEAISYVWGPTACLHPLVYDGQTLSITQNLEVVLRHCRQRKTARNLWVDAVCINQHDVLEKSEQIKLMGNIYASARHSLIWLGDAQSLAAQHQVQITKHSNKDPNDPRAIQAHKDSLRRLCCMIQIVKPLCFIETTLSQLTSAFRALYSEKALGEGEISPHVSSIEKSSQFQWMSNRILTWYLHRKRYHRDDGLSLMLNSEWFRRVWTFQELVLNRSPVIMCGFHTFPGHLFARTAIVAVPATSDVQGDATSRLRYCMNLDKQKTALLHHRTLLKSGSEQPSFEVTDRKLQWDIIKTLVYMMQISLATDPLDNVIGSLAVFQELGIELAQPDYSQCAADIYAQATLGLLRYTQSGLPLLLSCVSLTRANRSARGRGGFPEQETEGLTSWSLNWRIPDSHSTDTWSGRIYPGDFILSTHAAATLHSRLIMSEDRASIHELVLDGLIPQTPDHDAHTITQWMPAPNVDRRGFGGYTIRKFWIWWLLRMAMHFGVSRRDLIIERLSELLKVLFLESVDASSELAAVWDVAWELSEGTGLHKLLRYQHPSNYDEFEQLANHPKLEELIPNYTPSLLDEDKSAESARRSKLTRIGWSLSYMSMFVTNSGTIGLAAVKNKAVDDRKPHLGMTHNQQSGRGCILALLAGLDFPVLLRRDKMQPGKYSLVGVAAVSGMMAGDMWPRDEKELGEIVLI